MEEVWSADMVALVGLYRVCLSGGVEKRCRRLSVTMSISWGLVSVSDLRR